MKVVATQRGYLGCLRQPGDEFEVPDGTNGSWFEPVKADDEPAQVKRATLSKPDHKA